MLLSATACHFVCLNECKCNYAVLRCSSEMEYKWVWISRCASVSSSITSAKCGSALRYWYRHCVCIGLNFKGCLSISVIILKLYESCRYLSLQFLVWSSLVTGHRSMWYIQKWLNKKINFSDVLSQASLQARSELTFNYVIRQAVILVKSCILSHILSLTEWKMLSASLIDVLMSWRQKWAANYFLTYWRALLGLRNSQVWTVMWQEMTAQNL